MLLLSAGGTASVLTGHGALRYGTSMWAVMWSCAAMAVDSTLSWLYRSQYVALVAPTSCFGVAVMSESEYMQKVPQEKLLLVIRATFFPKSAKQPNVSGRPAPLPHHCDAQGAQGVKGLSPELAWPPQVGSYLTVHTCGREPSWESRYVQQRR